MASIGKLKRKIKRNEAVSGEWNGDMPGIQEERAHNAEDTIHRLKKKIAKRLKK